MDQLTNRTGGAQAPSPSDRTRGDNIGPPTRKDNRAPGLNWRPILIAVGSIAFILLALMVVIVRFVLTMTPSAKSNVALAAIIAVIISECIFLAGLKAFSRFLKNIFHDEKIPQREEGISEDDKKKEGSSSTRKTLGGKIVMICVLLFFLVGFGIMMYRVYYLGTSGATSTHPYYKRLARCYPVGAPHDYSDYTSDEPIVIPMAEGCYGDEIILSTSWNTFTVYKPRIDGGYGSVWCDGHPFPDEVVENNTDGMEGTDWGHCLDPQDPNQHSAHFRTQGYGVLIFTVTSRR